MQIYNYTTNLICPYCKRYINDDEWIERSTKICEDGTMYIHFTHECGKSFEIETSIIKIKKA